MCPEKNNSQTNNNGKSWTPLMRQLLISSGVWPSYFVVGLCMGAPTVFVPQIKKETNSTIVLTDEITSWLSSATTYASIPWGFILPIIAHIFGRKFVMVTVYIASLLGYIIFYYSTNVTHIFIYNCFLGLSSASQVTTSIFVLTEYTSPRYRGIFLCIKSASFFWGIWISNVIGTFFYWRYISTIGIFSSLYAIFSICFWPESPLWLARKKKFAECAKSHRWLKGLSVDSELELEKLLVDNGVKKACFNTFYKTFVNHKLYKHSLLTATVISMYVFSGKIVCSIYAIDILKNITSSEESAYMAMLVLDGVTVFAMYIGCILSRFVKRRTQLLVSSSMAVVSLLLLSLYLYLVRTTVVADNKLLSLALLTVFSLSICCGPIIMSTSLIGEFLPLKCRNFCVITMALIGNIFMATSIKFGPLIFKTFGTDGAFLFYGISSAVFLFIAFIFLPETKDKTLQEIQDIIYSNKKKERESSQLLQNNKR